MNGLVIGLVDRSYRDGDETNRNPPWNDIEAAIRSLKERAGRIEIVEDRPDGTVIVVAGSPGVYALDVLIDDQHAAMLVNQAGSSDSLVEVYDEEYREDQVVFELEALIEIVKRLVDAYEFVAPGPLKWEHRLM